MGYIYKIENKVNGKVYIGATTRSADDRWREHIYEQQRSKHRRLYSALSQYGEGNFDVSVIEKTDDLEERERYWIEYYNSFQDGYNETLGGGGKPSVDYDLVVDTYRQLQNAEAVAKTLGIDADTVRKTLHKKNVDTKSGSDIARDQCGRSVAMYDKSELKATFPTLGDAARYLIQIGATTIGDNNLNGIVAHIGKVCNGKRHTAFGYYWQFA